MNEMQDFLGRLVLDKEFRSEVKMHKRTESDLRAFLNEKKYRLDDTLITNLVSLNLDAVERNYNLNDMDDKLPKQLGLDPNW